MNDKTVLDRKPVSAPVVNNGVRPQGSLHKEAPAISSPELQPAGPEVKHNLEGLEESGVKENADTLNLTSEHKDLGMDHAGATVPVPSSLSDKIQLPSPEEIERKSKTGPSDSSEKWFMALLKKIMEWKLINR